METTFRWRNWLSVSMLFFLIFGVIKVGRSTCNAASQLSIPRRCLRCWRRSKYWAARLLAGGFSLRHPDSGTPSATGDQKDSTFEMSRTRCGRGTIMPLLPYKSKLCCLSDQWRSIIPIFLQSHNFFVVPSSGLCRLRDQSNQSESCASVRQS